VKPVAETLHIDLGDGYAYLYLEGMEGKHYFRIRNDELLPDWYVIEEYLFDHVIHVDNNPYGVFGVDDLRGLVEKLTREPQPTLAKLTGIWVRIERVVVR
jgi:hypothetical protein